MPFEDIVKKMHSRALTNPGDVLKAFAGISQYFSSQYGWTFWYGIPVERFDQCMLFRPAASSRQREGFPTWSWAGWETEDANADIPDPFACYGF